ncbi:hypothetical protein XENOCAPTIV_014482, partial [Xenoophorus captivus]
DYYKALEDADEKVQLANQIYDLVDRHLRKLDQELAKFKMELEADNAGITEILERRERLQGEHTRYLLTWTSLVSVLTVPCSPVDPVTVSPAGCRTNSTPSSTNSVYSVNSSQSLASYSLSSLPAGPGAGAGAITMAAAQAVQATAQVRDGLGSGGRSLCW